VTVADGTAVLTARHRPVNLCGGAGTGIISINVVPVAASHSEEVPLCEHGVEVTAEGPGPDAVCGYPVSEDDVNARVPWAVGHTLSCQ
jgi:hypothetical protein